MAVQALCREPLAVLCLYAIASQQDLPLEIGKIVGTFIIRLIGAVLLEQNDEWQLQHRYMQVEAMAELVVSANEAETRQIAA